MQSDELAARGAPHRIWADQDNLTWVEEWPGEAIRAEERPYILATPAALAASPEVQAMIREAEARGRADGMESAAFSIMAACPTGEGAADLIEIYAALAELIRAEAAALKGKTT